MAMNATMPQPDIARRHFTLEEANRSLPLVKMIVRDIVALYTEVCSRRERLEDLKNSRSKFLGSEGMFSDELEEMETSIDTDIVRLREYIDELTALGIELKDPEIGLIDFLSLKDGKEICLCWKQGEEIVGFWHGTDEGLEDRKTVS
ncbi:hypothetical protein Pan54_53110 [Rubinisphaera italica]|uniref:DUF2203 domain-containing protein n=2 Tax=Rubinisphaera italica TaxID=2527969 RepID=A0A5C5XMX6_9PLAN|nr:hypothetical protein Pan54_53110 [Rubinisphaera italica]|tara:strand:- start:28 stop:468 length:441 start_codon:yes stop_codon:yes gene_type:complete